MSRFKASVRGGVLFKAEARVDFLTITGRMYDHMKNRPMIKKAGGLPFTKDEFRQDVLGVLGGKKDGCTQCRYCKGHFTIAELSPDHAVPLSRQGQFGLANIDYPCQNCNQAKGSLEPWEFLELIDFCETRIPLGRKDVLGRLSKASSLAAQAGRARARLRAIEGAHLPPAAPVAKLQALNFNPEEPF